MTNGRCLTCHRPLPDVKEGAAFATCGQVYDWMKAQTTSRFSYSVLIEYKFKAEKCRAAALAGVKPLTVAEAEPTPTLEHWTSLLEDVKVPLDLLPALACARPELISLAKPRKLSAAECAAFLHLVRVLLETNVSLQERCTMLYGMAVAIDREAAVLKDAAGAIQSSARAFIKNSRWGDPVDETHDAGMT